MAKVVAINTKQLQFNPENRLLDPWNLLTICFSLVIIVVVIAKGNSGASYKITEFKLTHFSIKEYLIFNRIWNGLAF
jgi:hypothetical protein